MTVPVAIGRAATNLRALLVRRRGGAIVENVGVCMVGLAGCGHSGADQDAGRSPQPDASVVPRWTPDHGTPQRVETWPPAR